MPFTLAHPAAVLPLVRGPLVPAALVAGSLSPDVPYFVPAPRYAGAWYEPFVNATTTHAWPGALTVAVPTAVVLLALWWVVRAPLADLLVPRADVAPGGGRHGAGPRRVAEQAGWVVVSLVVGVLTHVVWDSFTHGDGVVVQHVAWLREPLVGDVPAGRVLQHVSTVVGLVVLAAWAARRTATWHAAGGRPASRGVVVAGALALIGAGAGTVAAVAAHDPGAGVEHALAAAAKGGGAAVAVAVLLGAVAWHVHRAATRATARPVPADGPSAP
ncbi:DUF4184 family protein [Cellulomonas oligotrophica]|uniref:DUF4184 domain-containing protein n=1 Tax=Cellulomonas oligotrophica TaxID=931536 RepID=A0A7Y9JYK1_9CELL|nr:DUF4184 family protein [Cellulomonas oligotrophica]NYD86867.1 hypothetical protein [Cellulomonas oligotrophica]